MAEAGVRGAGGVGERAVDHGPVPRGVGVAADQAATSDADGAIPTGLMLAGFNNGYTNPASLVALQPTTISNVGGSQPHENQQPYLTLSFCIALQGIFPSQT